MAAFRRAVHLRSRAVYSRHCAAPQEKGRRMRHYRTLRRDVLRIYVLLHAPIQRILIYTNEQIYEFWLFCSLWQIDAFEVLQLYPNHDII